MLSEGSPEGMQVAQVGRLLVAERADYLHSSPASANQPSGRSACRHHSSQYHRPVCLALSHPDKASLLSTSGSRPAHRYQLKAGSPFSSKLFRSETRDKREDLSDKVVKPFI